jgi:diacylglycerol kinase family enzyme
VRLRLVMNPGSRSGRGRQRWRTWDALLRSAGCETERCLTTSLAHARELARDSRGADAVVAVGGDGTINAVLDGVLQSGRSDLAMGVLYSGTSPDFCRFHGIPIEPGAAVTALLSGRRRRVDAASITFADANGTAVTAHFGCGSNIGLGAAVARLANRVRRFLGDGLGTGLATVAALVRVPPGTLTLECDGDVRELPQCNNLSILKSPFMASGLRLDLGLQPDDGELCVVALSGKSPAGLLRALPGFYTGRAVHAPGVQVWRCRHIVVRGPAMTEVEFDGDPRGFLPVTAEILPRSLTLLGVA